MFTISIVEKTVPFLFLSRLKFLFQVLYHEIELLSDVLHLLVLFEDLVLHTEYEITMHLISFFSVKSQNLFRCWLTLEMSHQIHYRLFLASNFIELFKNFNCLWQNRKADSQRNLWNKFKFTFCVKHFFESWKTKIKRLRNSLKYVVLVKLIEHFKFFFMLFKSDLWLFLFIRLLVKLFEKLVKFN